MPSTDLPRGIRNKNPGNLRSAVGPDLKTTLDDGFAVFSDMLDGCTSLAYLLDQYYHVLGIKTLPQFIERYAPATENDVKSYELQMVKALGLNPLSYAATDLRLDQPWRAIDFMRCIIKVECGPCPLSYNGTAEWVSPLTLVHAMARTNKWLYL
jgi:hypothetical protein